VLAVDQKRTDAACDDAVFMRSRGRFAVAASRRRSCHLVRRIDNDDIRQASPLGHFWPACGRHRQNRRRSSARSGANPHNSRWQNGRRVLRCWLDFV